MGAFQDPVFSGGGLLDLVLEPSGGQPNLEGLVSASDLQASLDRIKVRSEELRDQIQKVLDKHRGEFVQLATRAESTTEDVSNLSGEGRKVVEFLDGSQGSGADIVSSAAEFSKLREEIASKQRALHAVSLVSYLHKSLHALAGQKDKGELSTAAESLKELEEDMSKLPKAAKEPVVFRHLSDGLSAQKMELEDLLGELFAEALVVDKSRAEVRVERMVVFKEKAVAMESLWEALETLGLLNEKLERLAEQLFDGPIISCFQSSDPLIKVEVEDSEQGRTEQGQQTARLRWGPVEGNNTPSLLHIYLHLQTVLQFFQKHVANGDRRKALRLGKLLWPKITRALTDGPLLASVPADVSKLPEFEVFAKASQEFERASEALDFIPSSEEGHELSAFVHSIDVHFVEKKRTSFLASARQVLMQPDWCYRTVEVGSEASTSSMSAAQKLPTSNDHLPPSQKAKPLGQKNGPEGERQPAEISARQALNESGPPETSGRDAPGPFFELQTCQVSEAVQQLVQLSREALQEAAQSTAQIAQELHRTARDVLELYRAFVPLQKRHQLESVPQLAMVFHNDCLYIRHHLLLLAPQYKSRLAFPPMFLDLAPAFQQLAERTRLRQVAQQREELMRAVDEGKGFKYTDEESNFKGAERALKKVLHILGHRSAIWRPVLSADVFFHIMTSLTEAAVARVTSEVLQLDDIAVEETTQLRQLLRTLLEGLPDVLKGTQKEKQAAEGGLELVLRQVPTGRKLQRLIDILDMSLRDINAAWASGNLPSCGFKAHEVQRLIKAIFSETPLQKEVLDRIEATKAKGS